jgi:hypothetical protein
VDVVLYTFTLYVGVILAVALFASDNRSQRAERVLRDLVSLIKKNGADK